MTVKKINKNTNLFQVTEFSIYLPQICLSGFSWQFCASFFSFSRDCYPAHFASPPFSVPLRSNLLCCVLLPLHCDQGQLREGRRDRQIGSDFLFCLIWGIWEKWWEEKKQVYFSLWSTLSSIQVLYIISKYPNTFLNSWSLAENTLYSPHSYTSQNVHPVPLLFLQLLQMTYACIYVLSVPSFMQ